VIESIEIYRVQVLLIVKNPPHFFLVVHKKLPRTKIGQNSFWNVVSENDGYVEKQDLLQIDPSSLLFAREFNQCKVFLFIGYSELRMADSSDTGRWNKQTDYLEKYMSNSSSIYLHFCVIFTRSTQNYFFTDNAI
jgi:hypothetical protein